MTTQPLRSVLVANQKGGVGKTSIVTSVASMVAATGRRVLIVDADQQANATVSDLGVEGDGGGALSMALQYAQPLTPLKDVRPNLDLVAGGTALALVGAAANTAAHSGIDMRANLVQVMSALQQQEGYDLVLVDSGPGDAPLLDALLGSCTYLVVPTKDDDASLSGVELLARRYLRARRDGAAIELLGVVLFDVNPRATVRNRDAMSQIEDLLEGSNAQPFQTMIRSDRAAAVDLRTRHLTPSELVAAAEEHQRTRIQQLRTKIAGERRMWSRDPSGLASDYQLLTREILQRVAERETAAVPGGVS
ncbi:ParA family protein [Hoyosella altamirensis]|uniref:Cellulose biosynthesis protein BcsQ n=1 Tax=Hoyosella altamirensis TaxID=616997 RepID=A0A839RUX6_9ACTN|nr:ParA family protein [Hoyosella altamirensis]MBB3040036.1 cellulose biosynthesis protein BcsQ [Hoyosella altamirensis]